MNISFKAVILLNHIMPCVCRCLSVSNEKSSSTRPQLVSRHDERMTENGEDSGLRQPCEAPAKGDSIVNESRTLKTLLVDVKTCKEQNDAVKHSQITRNTEGEIIPYQPRPPSLPRLSKGSRSVSLEETVRTRRLRNSQESLSDSPENGSSTDSLKEDQAVVLSGAATLRNDQASNVGRLPAAMTDSPVFRDRGNSLSEYERRPHSQQSDPTDHRLRSTKLRLSPVQPTGPLPALERSFASATLRAANRIDRDCLDYVTLAKGKLGERLHRNLSDSRLLENMGSDSASVNSMRSTYSVLSPIRPQDVRNRYSSFSRPCRGCSWSYPHAGCERSFCCFTPRLLEGYRFQAYLKPLDDGLFRNRLVKI